MNPSLATDARHHRADYVFIMAMGLLLLGGLIIIYSISPVLSHKLLGDVSDNYFLYNQLLHIGLGLAGFALAANINYASWQRWLPVLIVVSGLSLLLLMIPGLAVAKNGATRWVGIGAFSYQPSEVIKFTLVVFLATRFSQTLLGKEDSRKRLTLSLAVLAILALFVMIAQRDLGTMAILGAILVGQFYISGVRLSHLVTLLAISSGAGIASILIFPHRLARVLTYLDPSQSTSADSYHLNQALIAIGSGGFLGLGIGKSIQVYGYLPEAANDSIFAIIGETMGFFGSILVLSLFGILLYRGFKIAMNSPNRYAQLLVAGIMMWIGAQTVINIAAMIGLIPLTGVPLPFLSYGGTSLIMTMFAMGIVVNVSKYTRRGLYADSSIRRRDRRPRYAYSDYRPQA